MVLDLKIFMYRNADEIEKLKKIKEDSDREAATVLQQLKTLSESRDSMQRELVDLKEVRDAALEVAEAMDTQLEMGMTHSHRRGGFAKFPELLRGLFQPSPANTWVTYLG